MHSLPVGLTPSEQSTIVHYEETKVLLTKQGSKKLVIEKKPLHNSTNKLNIQPTLSALPDGFQWKYAAFSQVVLWKTTSFSQVKGKFKHKKNKTFLFSKANISPCFPELQFSPAFLY